MELFNGLTVSLERAGMFSGSAFSAGAEKIAVSTTGSGLGGAGVGVAALLLSEERFKVFSRAEICRAGRT